jgi:hypothetical protein
MTTKATGKPLGKCPECGGAFTVRDGKGATPLFCSRTHQARYNQRQASEGKALVLLVKAWRVGRNKKNPEAAKWAFGEFCSMADRLNAGDRAEGRQDALTVLERRHRREGIA